MVNHFAALGLRIFIVWPANATEVLKKLGNVGDVPSRCNQDRTFGEEGSCHGGGHQAGQSSG